MIKDSKLIGTKIATPFGWKTFKVGELFDVQSTNAVNYDELMSDGKYPYVVRSANNNGIREYMSGDLSMLNKGQCITLGIDTASYFYQDCDKFFAGVKVKALYLLNQELSENIALYLIECLSRYVNGYGYAGGKPFKVADFLNELLVLPVTSDNQPDFEWMSAYIKAIKTDYLEQKELSNQNEIKAYLSAGNVDSTDVTDDERQFLRDFEKLPRRKFKVGELFDKIGPVSDQGLADCVVPFNQDLSSSSVNCATAGVNNNGCPMIAPRNLVNPSFILNLGITVSANGANTGSVFVQTNPFVVLQDSYALVFKRSDLSVEDYLFVASLIVKYKCTFNYQVKAIWSRVSNLEIELPVIDSSQIDVQSIEKYMQIQSKPLINNVVKALVPVGGGQP